MDCEFQAGKDCIVSVALALGHNAWHIMVTLKRGKIIYKDMNWIRQSPEESKSLTKVYSCFPDDADKVAQKYKLMSTYTFGSDPHSSDFQSGLELEATLITDFNFTNWYNFKKENSLNDLGQFPKMLLSLKNLITCCPFCGHSLLWHFFR